MGLRRHRPTAPGGPPPRREDHEHPHVHLRQAPAPSTPRRLASGARLERCRLVTTALVAAALVSCGLPSVLLPRGDLLRDVHLRGAPDVSIVALTFDDGPNGRCTAEVLDALAEVRAPATFFLLGRNVDAGGNDDLLARMVREGHTIGLHGYHHEGRMMVVPGVLRDELRAAARAVDAALGRAGVSEPPPIRLFRPPFGFVTEGTARAAAAAGLEIVEWTISVGDWKHGRLPEEIATSILAGVRPGDVIVLHDGDRTHQRSVARCINRAVAAETVLPLVPALRARGLSPAPIAEVLRLSGDSRSTAEVPAFALPPVAPWRVLDRAGYRAALEAGTLRLGLVMDGPFDAAKPTVVFIHGAGGAPSQFKALADALGERANLTAFLYDDLSRLT